MPNLRKVLLTLLLLIASSCTHNNDKASPTNINFSYKTYANNKEYTANQFQEIPFKQVENINLQFYQGTLWVEIKVENQSKERKSFVIQNNDRINRNYQFYKLDTLKNKLHKNKFSDLKYNDDRSFNFSKPNFKITLEANEKATFYIHTTSDGRVVRATPTIVSLDNFIDIMKYDTMENIFFYGAIFIIFLINFFYWKIFKSKIYVYYILYIVISSFFYIGFDGYYYGYFIPKVIIDHLIFILFRFLILFLLLFSVSFLSIKTIAPKFYRFLINYTTIVIIGMTLYQLFFCNNEVGKIHIIEMKIGFGWIFIILSMVLISNRTKPTETKYYLLALLCCLVFVLIGVFNIYFPSNITGKVFFKIGTIIEFTIFTYTTATILGMNKKEVQQHLIYKCILEEKNTKLQLELTKINNMQIKKTDSLAIFKLLESNLTNENEWHDFKNKFQELNPYFLTNLCKKHPSLSKTEIRLLTLVKIGFTQKEISGILFIASDSVKKAKQRARKKMNICSSITLSQYLTSF